jgi:hypothetical protein
MPIEVEIDLYSGRPNPSFTLPDAAEFRRRLAGLPPLPPAAGQVRDGLGYRGVRVTGAGIGATEVVVSGGIVEIRDAAGGVTRCADPGRAFERWLVEAGSGQVPPGDLDVIRDDLAH